MSAGRILVSQTVLNIKRRDGSMEPITSTGFPAETGERLASSFDSVCGIGIMYRPIYRMFILTE